MAVALFAIPEMTHGAQPAKAPATKTPSAAAPVDDNATWFLAGRDGECAPLSVLQNKVVEFKEVKSPFQLSDKLKAMGHKTELKEFKAGIRPALEVRAPTAGIHVMFIKQTDCDKTSPDRSLENLGRRLDWRVVFDAAQVSFGQATQASISSQSSGFTNHWPGFRRQL